MKAFYCLIIYLSIHLCGYAILPVQFHFRHYNIENGISANNISALLQDQKGYIWIGTENGLSRFDGNQLLFIKKQIHSIPIFMQIRLTPFVKPTLMNYGWEQKMAYSFIIKLKIHLHHLTNKQATKPQSLPGLHILFKIKQAIYGLRQINKASFYITHKLRSLPNLKYHKMTILSSEFLTTSKIISGYQDPINYAS